MSLSRISDAQTREGGINRVNSASQVEARGAGDAEQLHAQLDGVQPHKLRRSALLPLAEYD